MKTLKPFYMQKDKTSEATTTVQNEKPHKSLVIQTKLTLPLDAYVRLWQDGKCAVNIVFLVLALGQ